MQKITFNEELRIENAPKLKVSKMNSLMSTIKTKGILSKDISNREFKEIVLVDEILEVEK